MDAEREPQGCVFCVSCQPNAGTATPNTIERELIVQTSRLGSAQSVSTSMRTLVIMLSLICSVSIR